MPRHGSRKQRAKFKRAAKSCKGLGKGFRACMRKHLKK